MENVSQEQMKSIQEKFGAFQSELAKEFGVILAPDLVLKKVVSQETSEEKVAEQVAESAE